MYGNPYATNSHPASGYPGAALGGYPQQQTTTYGYSPYGYYEFYMFHVISFLPYVLDKL